MDTNEVTYFSVMHTPRALRSPGGFYEAFFSWSGPRARFAETFWRRREPPPAQAQPFAGGQATPGLAAQQRLVRPQDLGAGHS